MTMFRWFSIGLGGLCAALAFWLWIVNGRLDREQTRAKLWEESAVSSQAALSELQRSYQALNDALKERENKLTAINHTIAAQRKQLREVEKNDANAADWGHTPVPDAVSGMLKNSGGSGSGANKNP